MNKRIAFIAATFLLLTNMAFAQAPLKEYKAGHSFNISFPEYMTRTMGLNSASAIQYKSVVKDVYGFVIFDTKEELQLVDMKFSSISEFYENFISDFLTDEENRKVSKPKAKSKGGINFIESDFTYYDKDAEAEIYYLVGIVETPKSYYKVLSWSTADNKSKFKSDFQNILYSLRD